MRRKPLGHWTSAILLSLIAVVVSCSRDNVSGPVSEIVDPVEQIKLTQQLASEQARIAQAQQQDQAVDLRTADSGSGSSGDADARIVGNLLYCQPLRYAAETRIIGRKGGELQFGRHRLRIPEGALSSNVVITGEAPRDSLVSVVLSPHGLRFAKPVKLTLDYDHCGETPDNKKVVQINELKQILEYQESLDYEKYEYINGWLNHFSKYGMAEN
jgi:hypothetical protein